MEAANKIRNAVAQVALLRRAVAANPDLKAALGHVKRVQARRFAGTYRDVLASGPHAAAAQFFLNELYSDKDYGERDAQFARIAGAIERLFPAQVTATSVSLAELHALTEELDQAMACAWLAQADPGLDDAGRYALAWRAVGRRADRERQLSAVLEIGREMAQLTRTPGLRMLLKIMRKPALSAGMGSLQRFLESGFDIFAAVVHRGGVEDFLATIEDREAALIVMLFEAELVACRAHLARTLAQAPS